MFLVRLGSTVRDEGRRQRGRIGLKRLSIRQGAKAQRQRGGRTAGRSVGIVLVGASENESPLFGRAARDEEWTATAAQLLIPTLPIGPRLGRVEAVWLLRNQGNMFRCRFSS
jgi:hypothetical protein